MEFKLTDIEEYDKKDVSIIHGARDSSQNINKELAFGSSMRLNDSHISNLTSKNVEKLDYYSHKNF